MDTLPEDRNGTAKATRLSSVSRAELLRMRSAAGEVRDIMGAIEERGGTLIDDVLRGQDEFRVWNHYPEGDVFDPRTQSQYYYHVHPTDVRRPGEHGHFHTFLRAGGMPPGVRPKEVDGAEPGGDDLLSHLIAISMDGSGQPIGLFTTNRWVTGETWFSSQDVIAMLDGFSLDHMAPSILLNRWITALFRLFRPQMVDLLQERDRVIAERSVGRPESAVFEDRELEVTSALDISIDDQIEAVALELGKSR